MIKHATSHGTSVLVCSILAAFLIEILKPKIPELFSGIENFSYKAILLFNLPISEENLSIIFVASLLALIWGVFFKLGNS